MPPPCRRRLKSGAGPKQFREGMLLNTRYWNIGFRTVHIVAASALFGGHVFAIDAEQLLWWLYLTIFTGSVLVLFEAYEYPYWCFQARGASVLVKLLLLCCIPWMWDYRVPILILVLIIASVGSHMPRRHRDYSFLHRREPR